MLLQASWYEHGRVRACEDGPVQHGHPVGQAGEGAAIRVCLRGGGITESSRLEETSRSSSSTSELTLAGSATHRDTAHPPRAHRQPLRLLGDSVRLPLAQEPCTPKTKGLPLPCGDPLPEALGVPTNWLPTLVLVVAGNPSVMAGREAAPCKANWARELSCSIRRWARGACTKHNPSVSCKGRAHSTGQQKGGGQVPDTGGKPRAGGTGGQRMH